MNTLTIGLFGTCGNSQWRKHFIDTYKEKGINYFNPQVGKGEWYPGLIDDENFHLYNDDIILFPITDETTGQGGLAEIGFSLLNTIRTSKNSRYVIYLIDDNCNDHSANSSQIEDSIRSRKLVKFKLLEKQYRNVFLVNTLDSMLKLSLDLYKLVKHEKEIKKIYKYGT